MKNIAIKALGIAKEIKNEAPVKYLPPSDGTKPLSQNIIPHSIIKGTRWYIEKVVFQINGTYEKGWFDACAVMMRRLLETLIIECFESYQIEGRIKNTSTGDFYFLSDLIVITLKETAWNLGRNTKQSLPKLKRLGDQAAHSRRYNAHRDDIDKLSDDFRTVCQELIYLAGLK